MGWEELRMASWRNDFSKTWRISRSGEVRQDKEDLKQWKIREARPESWPGTLETEKWFLGRWSSSQNRVGMPDREDSRCHVRFLPPEALPFPPILPLLSPHCKSKALGHRRRKEKVWKPTAWGPGTQSLRVRFLLGTGNYIQYPVIKHNGKEYEKYV